MVDKTNASIERGTVPVAQLRATVKGQVLVPGDAGYDEARVVYLGDVDQRPAVIVQPADAADVASVVTLARASEVPLAIKGGGHSIFCLVEGGIVLDMSSLRDLQIDTEARTAWVEAGLTAGEYTNAAAEHGLVTGFGDTGSVGLGGITVGGGIGYLVRKHGLTIDDLLAAEIVTADGQLRKVDADNEPDLFWAIRGGGGNFGVVTRMKFRMHELTTVTGGLLVLPGTAEAIAGFVEQARKAPEELSSIVNIIPSPPIPFVPEEMHGKPIIMAMLVFAGEGEEAEEALAPFRALGPVADMMQAMPYPGVYPPEEEGYHPVAASRNLFVDDVDLDDAALMLDRITSSTADMAAVQIRVLGGAMTKVADDATAFAHRDRNIMVNLAAMYSNPDDAAVHTAWVQDLTVALQKGVPGVYVNFLADDSEARIHEAYPEQTWARLRAVKRTYDPTNVFRVNNNIPPATD
ncbi:FAD linked oxidase-like protein [Alloactinosynnema sp. L-07]|uniref:FAD-binding oxidoreductase n=1 Tax=Alloactinosynnema sp. L-07 TaxID=1653480 RepID=UPI00065F089B|nr:FAD-binding oxidoreductase [Alloactinosynnema sp. L-07]CRK59427.1 FAD linked oxidase-like protein [Alloactinosynnema sp. L-07]